MNNSSVQSYLPTHTTANYSAIAQPIHSAPSISFSHPILNSTASPKSTNFINKNVVILASKSKEVNTGKGTTTSKAASKNTGISTRKKPRKFKKGTIDVPCLLEDIQNEDPDCFDEFNSAVRPKANLKKITASAALTIVATAGLIASF